MKYIITLAFLRCCTLVFAQPSNSDIQKVIYKINDLRSEGCYCGNKWMPPAQPLKWNEQLYKVSNSYARYMARNNHFDHISKNGEDLGDRLNKIGFKWKKIGENLGLGYRDFYSVVEAWKDSPSHCSMLMDPDMTEMGLSKHKLYWVQSFSGTPSYLSSISAY